MYGLDSDIYFKKLNTAQVKDEITLLEAIERAHNEFKLEEASDIISSFLKRNKTNVYAMLVLAQIEASLGNYEQCILYSKKGLNLDKNWQDLQNICDFCIRQSE